MAQKKAHEVDHFLEKSDSNFSLILIYGPDQGLVTERAKQFAKSTGIALEDPFSTIRLDAIEIDSDPAKLVDEARTLSLFGASRLIWVRGAASQKGLSEACKWLINEPSPNTFILIEAGDLKKGSSLRTLFEGAKQAMALPCYSDDGRAIDALIEQVLDEFKLTLSHQARQILRDHLGENRLVSRRELEKLCLYALKNRQIVLEDVMICVSNVSTNSQDQIIDSLIIGDIFHFSERFDRQCEAGTPLFLIISAAMRQFQQLQQLREAMDEEGLSLAAAIASAHPPVFYQRRKIVETALQRWRRQPIARALARLQDCLRDSRKFTDLAPAIVRQNLLALTVEAARLGQFSTRSREMLLP